MNIQVKVSSVKTAYNNEKCSYNCQWLDDFASEPEFDWYCTLFDMGMMVGHNNGKRKKHPYRCIACVDNEL